MNSISATREDLWQRRACLVRGIVQGVGFRPFVQRTATACGLSGFVRNQFGAVYLEVEGPAAALEEFAKSLAQQTPVLSRIESLEWHVVAPQGSDDFRITASVFADAQQVLISPDIATCADCLTELFDPADRRYRYPFLNCTNCGPRLTIIHEGPYDRQRTTMAAFEMCDDCRREYEDPNNRRFHAQPIACRACGPRLQLLTCKGDLIESSDPLADFAAAICEGKIGAAKSLGGYHLVCYAGAESTVVELRRRKHRDQKPFAVMMQSLHDIGRICELDESEKALLTSPQRPIVLLSVRRGRNSSEVAANVAPGNPYLGVMLPYTPLHHLLLTAVGGRPLVMTSGNQSDEPIAYEDDDVVARLGGIADLILVHDRPICVRCDDSVTRIVAGRKSPVRRSRGYAPASLSLPQEVPCPTLAVGGLLKSTFALGEQHLAFVSHHLGDLDHIAAYQAFEHDIAWYEQLFNIRPQRIVHDLHPDYASTGYSRRRAVDEGLELLAVQHHHAHVASCMAENGLTGPVIGLAFDGTGYGTDGAIWGGEFLIADYARFDRAAHFRYVGLPGGDAAIREPWRAAVAHLIEADCRTSLFSGTIDETSQRTVEQMVMQRFNTPPTSSVGRLFDAVAALGGICTHASYEGQAAMELEWSATNRSPHGSYPFEVTGSQPNGTAPCLIVDTRPLIRAVVTDATDCRNKSLIARRFQSTMVEITADVCRRLREVTKLSRVVLSGGVFMNALLVTELVERLTNDGFDVYRHQSVPANDGGLSLGQLAIAATVPPNRDGYGPDA